MLGPVLNIHSIRPWRFRSFPWARREGQYCNTIPGKSWPILGLQHQGELVVDTWCRLGDAGEEKHLRILFVFYWTSYCDGVVLLE